MSDIRQNMVLILGKIFSQNRESVLQDILKEKKKQKHTFEGSCLSMNKNKSHSKIYRKTQKALMRV